MYHQFRDVVGEGYGSYETFHNNVGDWWWWACFPGCLPDGEPLGPFESEDDAVIDAMEEEGEP